MTNYGVDGAGGALGVVQHERVGTVNARDAVVSREAVASWGSQVGAWK